MLLDIEENVVLSILLVLTSFASKDDIQIALNAHTIHATQGVITVLPLLTTKSTCKPRIPGYSLVLYKSPIFDESLHGFTFYKKVIVTCTG